MANSAYKNQTATANKRRVMDRAHAKDIEEALTGPIKVPRIVQTDRPGDTTAKEILGDSRRRVHDARRRHDPATAVVA